MVSKILEDNRLLKEDTNKLKLNLDAKHRKMQSMKLASDNHSTLIKSQVGKSPAKHEMPTVYPNKKEPLRTLTSKFKSDASPTQSNNQTQLGQGDNTNTNSEHRNSNFIRRMSIDSKHTNHSKSRSGQQAKSHKKSHFNAFAMVAEQQENLFVLNENSLTALIYMEMEKREGILNEHRALEKLALKNENLASLSHLISNQQTFVKYLSTMTENNMHNFHSTLCSIYVTIS